MEITRVKIILREYPNKFMWESLESWEKRINDAIKDLDVVAIRPIGMDGVLVEYMEECPNNAKKIQHSYPIAGTPSGNTDFIRWNRDTETFSYD